MARRLRRSDDRIVAGVCGGLAEYTDLDPTAVRAAFVILSVVSSAFPGLLVYALLWLIMPED